MPISAQVQAARDQWLASPPGKRYRELEGFYPLRSGAQDKEYKSLYALYLEVGLTSQERAAWRKEMREAEAIDAAAEREEEAAWRKEMREEAALDGHSGGNPSTEAHMDERMAGMESRLNDIEAQIQRLTGTHVELVAATVGVGGEITEGPHAEVVVAEGPPPGMTLAEWVSGISGSPGIVVDPGVARSTPCIRLSLGEGSHPLVYSRGIIGAMDEGQEALYCQEGYEDREASAAQKERLAAMKQAAQTCSQEAGGATTQEHLESYFSCLGRELKRQGVTP